MTDQPHGYGVLQKKHAFPQRVLHCALPAQRRKRHVPNSSNVPNAAGASTAPTNPPHCKKHLLPTSPIHVGCVVKNSVSFPYKTATWPQHLCPKFRHSGDPLSAIFWCLAGSSPQLRGSQRDERCAYATHKTHAAHACGTSPSPNSNLPCSKITCHSWFMQSHPLQQISGSQILLTNSQHTTPAPS